MQQQQSKDKETWPELIGKIGSDAKYAILADNPDLKIFVLPEGSMVTEDYRTDRVRIFINPDGKVASAPRIG